MKEKIDPRLSSHLNKHLFSLFRNGIDWYRRPLDCGKSLVNAGEHFQQSALFELTGYSDSGKSTLLKMLAPRRPDILISRETDSNELKFDNKSLKKGIVEYGYEYMNKFYHLIKETRYERIFEDFSRNTRKTSALIERGPVDMMIQCLTCLILCLDKDITSDTGKVNANPNKYILQSTLEQIYSNYVGLYFQARLLKGVFLLHTPWSTVRRRRISRGVAPESMITNKTTHAACQQAVEIWCGTIYPDLKEFGVSLAILDGRKKISTNRNLISRLIP